MKQLVHFCQCVSFFSVKQTRFISFIFFFSFLATSYGLLAQIQIVPNRPNSTYTVGETATFTVTAYTSGTLNYAFKYDEFTPVIQTNSIYLQAGVPAQISYAHPEPGFVFLKADLNGQTGKSAVVFSPNRIFSAEAEPSDFDAFWNGQKALLQNVPLNPQLQLVGDNGKTKDYSINLGNIDGRKVYGYISVPNGAGPFPALLHSPPFGWNANLVTPDTYLADELGAIVMHISIHNTPPNQATQNPYMPNDVTNRDAIYYRYAILGGLQAIKYLASRPDFDGQNLGVFGESQGGGLSMMLAGLDSRVNLLFSTIPALSDHSAWNYGKAAGFPQYLHWANVSSSGNPTYMQAAKSAVKYYDSQYFVKRYKGPLYTAASFLDETCPSNGVIAAHNRHLGPQIRVMSTKLEHSHPGSYWSDRPSMVRLYYPSTRTPQNNPYPGTSTGYKISAGADKATSVNSPVSLQALIEFNLYAKNGLPAQWDVISGPGTVNFSAATSYATQATFSQAGVYQVRFAARDEATIGSEYYYSLQDVVEVTVGGSVALPTISVADITVQENVGQASLQVCLSQASTSAVTVNFTTQNSSAIAGLDYIAVNNTLTIPAGTTCGTINVSIINDTQFEQTESFNVVFSNAQGATLTNTQAKITIIDNDQALPTVSVADITVQENVGQASLQVCLSQASTSAVTVNFTTQNSSAIAGLDYIAANNTLTIPAGTTCGTISVSILNDTQFEQTESFNVVFSNAQGATLTNAQAKITILDNDQIIPTLTPSSISIEENIGQATVQVCLSSAASTPVTFNYATGNGSAQAGSDYEAKSGSVTIPTGELCGTISITILNDAIQEGDETFNVILSNPSGATFSSNTSIITILQNDAPIPGTTICFAKSINYWTGWIKQVELNSLNKSSGGFDYTFYENETLSVYPSEMISLRLQPGFSANSFNMFWRVWVDWNNDKDFDDIGELVYQRSGYSTVLGTFSIPNSVQLYDTIRVRIATKRNGYPTACEDINVGEVEDYQFNITSAPVSCSIVGDISNIVCNDNNTPNNSSDDYWNYTLLVTGGTSASGWKAIFEGQTYLGFYGLPVTFTVPNPNGLSRTLVLSDQNNPSCTVTKSVLAPNVCSVAPPTGNYCDVSASFPWHEWISSVGINTQPKEISSKTTYSDYTGTEFQLSQGNNIVHLKAEYSWLTQPLYWQVWIDFNQNRVFELNERIVQKMTAAPTPGSSVTASLSENFTIPSSALSGKTRMRITCNAGGYKDACTNFTNGEVEDYTVIVPSLNLVAPILAEAATLTAKQDGHSVQLNWLIQKDATAIDKVWIEKAVEKDDFTQIVQNFYPNTSQGIVHDNDPTIGLNRYRLAILSVDGSIDYTKETSIVMDDFKLYPNPASEQISIDMRLFKEEAKVRWEIYDAAGKLMDTGLYMPNQANELQIRVKNLKNGIYVLTLSAERRRSVIQRFIVDKG